MSRTSATATTTGFTLNTLCSWAATKGHLRFLATGCGCRSKINSDVRDLNSAPTERRLAEAGWIVTDPQTLSMSEQLGFGRQSCPRDPSDASRLHRHASFRGTKGPLYGDAGEGAYAKGPQAGASDASAVGAHGQAGSVTVAEALTTADGILQAVEVGAAIPSLVVDA